MADMRSLYVRTARDFVKAMDTVVLELTQSLAAGDQKLAVMRLHTLKGNAGTLGATELAAHAASLEKLCKGDDGVVRCSAALDQFGPIVQSAQALLRAAIEQLEPEATHTTSQTTAQTAASQQAVHDALSQLIALADGLDMEALMHFAQVRDTLASVPGDWVDRLDESLQNLDLQTASVLGREMLAQLAS
jgi:HPt (histidine-containing phosphotransfer) domain-containing protein